MQRVISRLTDEGWIGDLQMSKKFSNGDNGSKWTSANIIFPVAGNSLLRYENLNVKCPRKPYSQTARVLNITIMPL